MHAQLRFEPGDELVACERIQFYALAVIAVIGAALPLGTRSLLR
jgi:hypothetical protein